jgi:topoisomerase-4 subunit A
MIYLDGKSGVSFAKRFNVTGITREKEYDLTKGEDKSKVHYLSVNANGEAEVVRIILSPSSSARHKEFDFQFEQLEIKGRSSLGNQVTKYPIRTVRLKEAGKSTLSGRKLWFDKQFGRLNIEEKGDFLGLFEGDDKILVIYNDGNYEITEQELIQRFEPSKMLLIEKFDPEKIVTAVYYDHDKQQFTCKRFKIETTSLHNKFFFIKEGAENYLKAVTTEENPVLVIKTGRGAQVKEQKLKVATLVEVMGWKAIGSKLVDFSKNTEVQWLEKPESQKKQTELF